MPSPFGPLGDHARRLVLRHLLLQLLLLLGQGGVFFLQGGDTERPGRQRGADDQDAHQRSGQHAHHQEQERHPAPAGAPRRGAGPRRGARGGAWRWGGAETRAVAAAWGGPEPPAAAGEPSWAWSGVGRPSGCPPGACPPRRGRSWRGPSPGTGTALRLRTTLRRPKTLGWLKVLGLGPGGWPPAVGRGPRARLGSSAGLGSSARLGSRPALGPRAGLGARTRLAAVTVTPRTRRGRSAG